MQTLSGWLTRRMALPTQAIGRRWPSADPRDRSCDCAYRMRRMMIRLYRRALQSRNVCRLFYKRAVHNLQFSL